MNILQANIDYHNDGKVYDRNNAGKRRVRHTLQLLWETSCEKTLDLGCGTGFIANFVDKNQYLGIDASRAMIDYAAEKYPGYLFCYGDIMGDSIVALMKEADVIVLSSVLHHLEDFGTILHRLWCKTDADFVILQEPNPWVTKVINFFRFKRPDWADAEYWQWRTGGIKPKVITSWFKDCDVTVVYTNAYLLDALQRRFGRIPKWIEWIVNLMPKANYSIVIHRPGGNKW